MEERYGGGGGERIYMREEGSSGSSRTVFCPSLAWGSQDRQERWPEKRWASLYMASVSQAAEAKEKGS